MGVKQRKIDQKYNGEKNIKQLDNVTAFFGSRFLMHGARIIYSMKFPPARNNYF